MESLKEIILKQKINILKKGGTKKMNNFGVIKIILEDVLIVEKVDIMQKIAD